MMRSSSYIVKISALLFCLLQFSLIRLQAQQSPHGTISIACTDCHTTTSWKELAKPMLFKHSTTGFELQGKHNSVTCIECHVEKKFTDTPSACIDCHQPDFTKALVPNHELGKFSRECAACHTMNGWRPSVFQHSKTNFQLAGAHQTVECASCHTNNRFAGLPSDCFSCHQQIYNQTTIPDHKTAQLSHDCTSCHSVTVWKPSTFNHQKTLFPLVGAHQTTDCASCHKSGVFKGISTDCYTCHLSDFSKSATSNHVTGQFSHDCTTCHSMTVWKPSTFDHQKTVFPLLGVHQTTECASCHKSGQFKGLATDCFTCHLSDFSKSATSNHVTGQFSHYCVMCHSMVAWTPATLDHNKTNFPLLGAHQKTDCSFCHKNGVYKGTPTDCYICHQTDFAKSTAANHVTGQFSHDCTTCHSMNVWKPATFTHTTTNFPLTGTHTTTDCIFCHKNGQFKGTPSDCYTCHVTNFTGVVDPNHVAGTFDHNCAPCHTTSAWNPATFDHSKVIFPLTGAHVQTACAKCHVGGKYIGLTTDCYTCHLADFTSALVPNHVTGVYAHDCITCHSTAVWQPWTFKHDSYYAITRHHASGLTCVQCHTTPGNLNVASCTTGCHSTAHNKTKTCYSGSNCHAGSSH